MLRFPVTLDITFSPDLLDELAIGVGDEIPQDMLDAIENAISRGKSHIWIGADGRDAVFGDVLADIRSYCDYPPSKISFKVAGLKSIGAGYTSEPSALDFPPGYEVQG